MWCLRSVTLTFCDFYVVCCSYVKWCLHQVMLRLVAIPKFLFQLSPCSHWFIFSMYINGWLSENFRITGGFRNNFESHRRGGFQKTGTRGLLKNFPKLAKRQPKSMKTFRAYLKSTLFTFRAFRTFKIIFISWHYHFKHGSLSERPRPAHTKKHRAVSVKFTYLRTWGGAQNTAD
jgi:hypothetical protein